MSNQARMTPEELSTTRLLLIEACVNSRHEWKKAKHELEEAESEWLAQDPYDQDLETLSRLRSKVEHEWLTNELRNQDIEILSRFMSYVGGFDAYYELFYGEKERSSIVSTDVKIA